MVKNHFMNVKRIESITKKFPYTTHIVFEVRFIWGNKQGIEIFDSIGEALAFMKETSIDDEKGGAA